MTLGTYGHMYTGNTSSKYENYTLTVYHFQSSYSMLQTLVGLFNSCILYIASLRQISHHHIRCTKVYLVTDTRGQTQNVTLLQLPLEPGAPKQYYCHIILCCTAEKCICEVDGVFQQVCFIQMRQDSDICVHLS